jgi:hypothetical protein
MSNRALGTIGMVCAPAILIQGILGQSDVAIGITGMIFMAGWICVNTAMRRLQAAGAGTWGRVVLLVQLVGLVLAFSQGIYEVTGLAGQGNILFDIADAAWPLSMLWMLVVGVSVIRARGLSELRWQRYIPLLCPFWLPIALILGTLFGDPAQGVGLGGLIGLVYATVLWGLLGYVIREASPEAPPTLRRPAVL